MSADVVGRQICVYCCSFLHGLVRVGPTSADVFLSGPINRPDITFVGQHKKNVCLCRQIEPTKKLSADINRLTEKQQQLRPICRAAVLWYATCSTLSTTTKRSTGTTLHGSFSGFDSDWLATDPVLSAFLSSVFGARQ